MPTTDQLIAELIGQPQVGWPDELADRLQNHLPVADRHLRHLYGHRDDYPEVIKDIGRVVIQGAVDRVPALREADRSSGADRWSHRSLGAVCYVDRFAGDLAGLAARLDYLTELGVTYLHVMPPYQTPSGGDDGGYAVSTYRQTDPALGTIDDLSALAAECRHRGITLVLDVVCNHTADDHPWAVQARAGRDGFDDFYFIYPDRSMPDRWETNLREIFPNTRHGSFTEVDGLGWVWTTFHSFQWDLDYRNPKVFAAMLGEMLFLANLGADVLRLDAVPFLWKEEGTPSENLPQVHHLLAAWRALFRIAAPAVVFKSEAIVHPDDVRSYMGPDECELSYNPVFMVGLWEALATGSGRLLAETMRRRIEAPSGAVWINYLRSHDDIGWGFADEDAAAVGLDGFEHRQWLNRFYTGEDEGSWARGLPFQFNPDNLDMRISGTTASLCGVDEAVASADPGLLDLAERRISALLALMMAMPGIPLIYLGDEIGTLNDHSYRDDPESAHDSRWAHRPWFDWDRAALRSDRSTTTGRIHDAVKNLARLRRERPAFAAGSTTAVLSVEDDRVLAFENAAATDRVLVVANLCADSVRLEPGQLPDRPVTNVISGSSANPGHGLDLAPYEVVWLADDAKSVRQADALR
jgi:amylosucrase